MTIMAKLHSSTLPISIHVEKAISYHDYGELDSVLRGYFDAGSLMSLADGDIPPSASLVTHRGRVRERKPENWGLRPCLAGRDSPR